MKDKQGGTMDRETALKLAALGGIGALLPLLGASADAAPKPKTPASGNPMNLSYTAPGTLVVGAAAKAKGGKALPTAGTLVIQMWADPDTAPAPAGTLLVEFDGDAVTAKGHFDDKCVFDGKAKNELLHIRVYFAAGSRK